MATYYKLKGNPTVNVPVIGNLLYDWLGKLLTVRYNEEFKSKPKLQVDVNRCKEYEILEHSNVPFNHFIAQLLLTDSETLKVTGGLIKLLSIEQGVANWNEEAIPEFKDTSVCQNSVGIYPNAGKNDDLRNRVLELMEKKSIRIPYIVSNLGVEPADNTVGFTFTRNEFTTWQEAPFLTRNQRVLLNRRGKLKASKSKKGVPVYISEKQLGLCRINRYKGIGFGVGNDFVFPDSFDLLSSGYGSRVQLIQTP